MATTKKTVYALFVAINAYKREPLACCINDATNLRSLLEADPTIELKPLTILDDKATKANIVEQFKAHLGQATKDDIALFFYAGHGVPEHADRDIWTEENDGRLEGLACYFNSTRVDNFILADKELRYLLAQLWAKTQASIVTIFDCCHSGDNTRGLYSEESKPLTRLLRGEGGDFYVFPQRNWDWFVFSDKLKPEHFKGKTVEAVIPSPPHIQIAAAESNEPAGEGGNNGYFSSALQEVLKQSNGFINYRNLHSGVLNRIRILHSQRPKLYAPAGFDTLKDQGFLGKDVTDKAHFALMTFTPGDKQFRVNRGAADGVEAGKTTVQVELDGKILRGGIQTVDLDTSTVLFKAEDSQILGIKDHDVTLDNLTTKQLKIYLALERDAAPNQLKKEIIATFDGLNAVTIADEEANSDYVLRANGSQLYITRPNDAFRPLFKPINNSDPNALEAMKECLKQMSKWHYLMALENKASDALPKTALKVEVVILEANGTETALPFSDTEGAHLTLIKNEKGKYGRTVKVKITNETDADLYVGAFVCAADFSIDKSYLLPDAVIVLEKGNSKYLRQDLAKDPSLIKLFRDPHYYWYNWEKYTDSIKFVFSPQQFDAQAFGLNSLPPPVVPNGKNRGFGNDRGMGDDEEEIPVLKAWNSKNLAFTTTNPDFDKVTDADKEEMKTLPETAFFGKGLYKI